MPTGVVVAISFALVIVGLIFLVPIATQVPTAANRGLETVGWTQETDIVSGARLLNESTVQTVTKTTQIEAAPSDVILVALASTGLVLVIAGVFFSRITSIKIAGTEFQMAALKKVTKAVTDLDEQGKVPTGTSPSQVLGATLLAAEEGVALVQLSKIVPSTVLSKLKPLDVPLTDQEIQQLSTSGTPTDELWKKLAEAALKKTTG